MAQLLVRNLDAAAVERLKARARAHGRSLEAEARVVLEQSARGDAGTFWQAAERLHDRLAQHGRSFSDSAADLREQREG